MSDLKEYIREEIEEEQRLGYLSADEGSRRIGLLDSDADPAADTRTSLRASEGVPSAAGAAQVAEDDSRATTRTVEVPAASGTLSAYLAQPASGGTAAGVIVVHENKGLVPYIEDVVRRLAVAGYVALAPDLLSRAGGTKSFADPAEATAALGKIAPEDMVADLQDALGYLEGLDSVRPGALAVLGFCFGGGMAWRLATKDARLKAAIPFYGPPPAADAVPGIQARVFAVYGELDERITSQLPAIEEAMSANGKVFERIVYSGAQHAFHNNTNPDRFHPDAAEQAWTAALEHLAAWTA